MIIHQIHSQQLFALTQQLFMSCSPFNSQLVAATIVESAVIGYATKTVVTATAAADQNQNDNDPETRIVAVIIATTSTK